MAIDVKKIGGISRSDLVWFDPEELVIVTDKDHPLYDERTSMEVPRELVNNIKVYGIIEPVIGRFNTETSKTEVVDGRQRTAAARVAKAEQLAAGEVVIRVPVIMRKEDDETVMGIMVSANEQRRDDAIKIKSKKAKRMSDMGMTKKEIANAFGVSTQTITIWLDPSKRKKSEANGSRCRNRIAVEAKLAELNSDAAEETYEKGYLDALNWVLRKDEQ